MVEAISEEAIVGYDFSTEDTFTTTEETPFDWHKVSDLSSRHFEGKAEETFLCAIESTMRDEHLAGLIHRALVEKGLEEYEKRLGSGSFGSVFQIEGKEAFEGKKLALKLLPQIPNRWSDPSSTMYNGSRTTTESSWDWSTTDWTTTESSWDWSTTDWTWDWSTTDWITTESSWDWSTTDWTTTSGCRETTVPYLVSALKNLFLGNWRLSVVTEEGVMGDALALNFPKGGALSAAYGALLYDGERVEFVEAIDPSLHKGKVVIGVLFLAAEGGNLAHRVSKLPPDSEVVKGYGKRLAQAIHELHDLGYAHCDIHSGNVLLLSNEADELQLADFGLTEKAEKSSVSSDWNCFGWLLGHMAKAHSIENAKLCDLLDNIERRSRRADYSPEVEREILNHPYFV